VGGWPYPRPRPRQLQLQLPPPLPPPPYPTPSLTLQVSLLDDDGAEAEEHFVSSYEKEHPLEVRLAAALHSGHGPRSRAGPESVQSWSGNPRSRPGPTVQSWSHNHPTWTRSRASRTRSRPVLGRGKCGSLEGVGSSTANISFQHHCSATANTFPTPEAAPQAAPLRARMRRRLGRAETA
jgi:hypothetical protein